MSTDKFYNLIYIFGCFNVYLENEYFTLGYFNFEIE